MSVSEGKGEISSSIFLALVPTCPCVKLRLLLLLLLLLWHPSLPSVLPPFHLLVLPSKPSLLLCLIIDWGEEEEEEEEGGREGGGSYRGLLKIPGRGEKALIWVFVTRWETPREVPILFQ